MQKEFKPKINPLLHNDDRYRLIIEEAIQYAGSKFSWLEIEDKLRKKRDEFPDLIDNLYARVLEAFFLQAQIKYEPGTQLVHFRFTTKEYSAAFLSFLSSFLPLQDEAYPSCQDDVITLSELQYYFCNIYYSSWFPSKLKEVIADHYLLKSLRSDEFDFSHRFIRGIIPQATGSRRQNLRPIRRKSHTITHERKVVERLKKVPMYTQETKKGYSQIQSTTLIDEEMRSSVFGTFKQRTNKLYGVMTHCDDALMNRLLIRDCGTVARPFDVYSDTQEVNGLAEYIYSPDNIEEFKAQNLLHRKKYGGTNEVLARLRFNPYRTMVCICANTLEARLLAYDFSQELLQEFLSYAKENNIKVNPNFKIPIIFYLPAIGESSNVDTHRVFFYTESMRKNDLQSAVGFYNFKNMRVQRFYDSDYEFLLGLPQITLDILKQPGTVYNSPLAIDMIDRGYIRMLMRILRGHNLAEELFDDFIRNNLIKKDSYIIANLIEVEEFEIANKLIKATNTNINALKFRESSLVNHVLSYGTPRQIDYLGKYHIDLEFLLLTAAQRSNWPTIKLYLREYPTNNKVLLGKLLFFASFFVWNTPDARFFLKMGADISFCNKEKDTAVLIAAKTHNWELVSLICDTPTDSEDNAKFGTALVLALAESRMDIATVLLNAGAKPPESFNLEGSKLINLIESIFQNKIEEKFLPFISCCVTYWSDLKPWFKSCCENKYYNYLGCLMKLNINFSYLISGNRNLLSTMILDEEFAIADKLMEAGKIDAFRLSHGGVLLVDYIVMHGNYSHFKFVGCEKMLVYLSKKKLWERLVHWLSAVEVTQGIDEALFAEIVDGLLEQHRGFNESDWVAFRQFVQRFLSHFRLPLLGKILAIAFDKEQYEFVQYLLRNGVDWPISERCRFPMLLAIQKCQWEIVREMAQRDTDLEDNAKYGEALILALVQTRIDIATLLLKAGAKPPNNISISVQNFTQVIELIFQHNREETFFPFMKKCKVYWTEIESWFKNCFEKKHYRFIDYLLRLNVGNKYAVRGNAEYISNMILDEEYTIADKLIALGEIDKFSLKYGNNLLVDHIIENGKYSQFEFVGCEKMLFYLSEKKLWERLVHWLSAVEVTQGIDEALFAQIVDGLLEWHRAWVDTDWIAFRQFVERFLPHFNPALLRKILVIALDKGHYLFAHYLVLNGADWTMAGYSEFPLLLAAESWKWEIVEELINEKLVENAGEAYSRVLMIALSAQKGEIARILLDRGIKPLWVYNGQSYPLPTEKFYQLINQMSSLTHKKANVLRFEYFYQSVSAMLVMLPSVSSEMLLHQEVCFPLDFLPLAALMINIGCSAELIQLLLKDRVEAQAVLQSPVIIRSITRNPLFISECICACAFELSDQLLKLTHAHKMNLKYGNKSLLDHLVENGNLEQWIYFGLEDIVRKLAQLGDWDKIFELIDSHSVLAYRQYLGVLLHEAAKQHELALVDLLLKKGADTAVYTGSVPVLCQLASDEKWELIELFCDYDSDVKDDAQYGYAAVIAFRNKRIDLALKLLSRGGLPVQLANFESALFYAVKYELVDWIPRLIESEKKWANNDPKWECSGAGVYFSPWRCALDHSGYNNILFARDYAEAKSNAMIKSFFEPFSKLYYNPPLERDPYNYYVERVHTTQVFLEAAIYEDAQFATHRMLKFAKHYKLVCEDENNVLKVFEAIGTCCYWGIKNYPSPTKKVIYKIFRAVLERALKDNNQVDHQVCVKFFASEMPDKEYVARIVSRIHKGEINSYDEYLSKAKFQNQASCHTEETVDNSKDTRSHTLVH